MKNNNLSLILVVVIFSILSAFLVSFLTLNYGAGDSGFSFGKEIDINNYAYLNPGLLINEPKKVVVNQDLKLEESVRNINYDLFWIFEKIEDTSHQSRPFSVDAQLEQVEEYYDLREAKASALAITSDGWVLSFIKLDESLKEEDVLDKYIVIDSNRNIYEIDQLIKGEGDLAQYRFFHLKGIRSLNLRRLVPDQEIRLGQSLILLNQAGEFSFNILSGRDRASSYSASDEYERDFSLAYPSQKEAYFIFNISGELLALVSSEGDFLAAPLLDAYARSLFKTGGFARASTGISYLNLSSLTGTKYLDKGIEIYAPKGEQAILKDSAAEKAGLKALDVIIRVNGVEINNDNDFSALVVSYNPGDLLNIEYLRGGELKNTQLILDQIVLKEEADLLN